MSPIFHLCSKAPDSNVLIISVRERIPSYFVYFDNGPYVFDLVDIL